FSLAQADKEFVNERPQVMLVVSLKCLGQDDNECLEAIHYTSCLLVVEEGYCFARLFNYSESLRLEVIQDGNLVFMMKDPKTKLEIEARRHWHHWHAITRVFKYLKDTMNDGLSYVGYSSVLEGYSDARWINYVKDSSSTSSWVFLLWGALAAGGKEAEWLRNLIHEIMIWSKPIASISIHCDSAATLAKAYSQIYNVKSRHLGKSGVQGAAPLVRSRGRAPSDFSLAQADKEFVDERPQVMLVVSLKCLGQDDNECLEAIHYTSCLLVVEEGYCCLGSLLAG
ncbi:hypothetical protein Tco_0546284, partial [Tanacetum coccineum]